MERPPSPPKLLKWRFFLVAVLVFAAGGLVAQLPRLAAGASAARPSDVVVPGDLYWRLSCAADQWSEKWPALDRLATVLEDNAIASYERRTSRPGLEALCRHRLLVAYGRRGYKAAAGRQMSRLLDLDPSHGPLWTALGRVYAELGPHHQRGNLAALLRYQPDWLAYLTLSDSLQALGQPIRARRAAEAAGRDARRFASRWLGGVGLYALLALPGVALLLAYLIASAFGSRLPTLPLSFAPSGWQSLDVLEVLALMAFLLPLGAGLAGMVSRSPVWAARSVVQQWLVLFAQYGLAMAFPVLLVWYRAGRWERPAKCLGLTVPNWRRMLGAALAGSGAGLLLLAAVRGWPLSFDFGESGRLPVFVTTAGALLGLVPALLLLVIAAPVLEEIIFRGFVFAYLRRRVGLVSVFAALISGLLFALAHPDSWSALTGAASTAAVAQLILRAGMGTIAALAYESSGSLWSAILIHALWNLRSLTAAFVLLS